MRKPHALKAFALCCALLISASACTQQPQRGSAPEQEVSSSGSAVSSAAAPSSPVSREEAGGEPASSSQPEEFSSQPASSSEEESGGEAQEYLPQVETGSENFRKAFSANPIDSQFELEYSSSTSATLMARACADAEERWKAMVDVAYRSALDAASEGEQESIKESQGQWAAAAEQQLQEIWDGAESQLEAARGSMLFYRERAAGLCNICYSLTGSLPDFNLAFDSGEAMG